VIRSCNLPVDRMRAAEVLQSEPHLSNNSLFSTFLILFCDSVLLGAVLPVFREP